MFVHESGETIYSGQLHVPAAKQDPQGYGSALTYARRYSLMTACGIAPEDDDGNAAVKPSSNVSATTIAAHIADIQDSANSDEMTAAYKLAYEACQGEPLWIAKVVEAKKARQARAQREKEAREQGAVNG
jgi:hypothetical protein